MNNLTNLSKINNHLKQSRSCGVPDLFDLFKDFFFEEGNNSDFPYRVTLIHKISILEDYLRNEFNFVTPNQREQKIIDDFVNSYPDLKQQREALDAMRSEYKEILRQQMP